MYSIMLILNLNHIGSMCCVLYFTGKVQEKAVSITGLGTAILEETDEGWRIHHLHTSAPRDQLEGMGGE